MNCDGSQARWGTASLTFWFCMIIIQKLKDPQKHETCQLSCRCITLSARAALLYTKYHSKFTRKNVTINKNRCPVVGFAQTCGRHWCVCFWVCMCVFLLHCLHGRGLHVKVTNSQVIDGFVDVGCPFIVCIHSSLLACVQIVCACVRFHTKKCGNDFVRVCLCMHVRKFLLKCVCGFLVWELMLGGCSEELHQYSAVAS